MDPRLTFQRPSEAELAAIRRWAEEHPAPNEPLPIAGAQYSPREILCEIEEGSELGARLLRGWRNMRD